MWKLISDTDFRLCMLLLLLVRSYRVRAIARIPIDQTSTLSDAYSFLSSSGAIQWISSKTPDLESDLDILPVLHDANLIVPYSFTNTVWVLIS